MLINTKILREDENYIYGEDIFKYGSIIPWIKSKKKEWITKSREDRWSDLGFSNIPMNKIKEFEDIITESFYDGIWYFIVACYNSDLKNELPDMVMNWILGSIAEIMNERKDYVLKNICPAIRLNTFLQAMIDNKFNKSKAKKAFRDFIVDFDINQIINNSEYQVADNNAIDKAIEDVMNNNVEMVEKAKLDPKFINWLVGQVMKTMAGRAAAPEVREKITNILNEN